MSDTIWVSVAAAITIHDQPISRHGGAPGLRDHSLLEEGVARPLNKLRYGVTDLFELGAAYAFGIAKAHAFVDGNKRTTLVPSLTFLLANGVHVRHGADKTVRAIEDLAQGAVNESEFSDWLKSGRTSAG